MKQDLAKLADSLCGSQLSSLRWPRQLPAAPAAMDSALLGMTKVLLPNVSPQELWQNIHTHVQTS